MAEIPVSKRQYVTLVTSAGDTYDATGVAGGPAVTIADGADATLGAIADAAVTNPASSATVVALLKGILTLLTAGNVSLAAIKTNTDRIP